jgi:hypothetical protein
MDATNQERIDSQAILSKIGEWLFGRVLVKPDALHIHWKIFRNLKIKEDF